MWKKTRSLSLSGRLKPPENFPSEIETSSLVKGSLYPTGPGYGLYGFTWGGSLVGCCMGLVVGLPLCLYPGCGGLVFQGNAGFFPYGSLISVDLCYHVMFGHVRDMDV